MLHTLLFHDIRATWLILAICVAIIALVGFGLDRLRSRKSSRQTVLAPIRVVRINPFSKRD